MEVGFRRVSNDRHTVRIVRDDGSSETVELDTRSFLRHDLAHFAVEVELGLTGGVWGSVAAGGSLSGDGLDGPDMALAERLAGPMQTMMRLGPGADAIADVLMQVAPEIATCDLAERLHARAGALIGHWAGTGFHEEMTLTWP